MDVIKKGKRLRLTAWILLLLSFLLASYGTLGSFNRGVHYSVNVICILMAIISVILLFRYYHKYKIENYHILILMLFLLHYVFTFIRMDTAIIGYSDLGRVDKYEYYVSLIGIIVSIIYCFVRKRVLSRICMILWLGANLVRTLYVLYFYMQNGLDPTGTLLMPVILYGAMIILLILQSKATAGIGAVAIILQMIYKIWQLVAVLTFEIYPGFTILHIMLGYAYTVGTVLNIAMLISVWFREGGRLLFKRKIPYEQIEAELLDLKTRFDKGEISARKYSRLKEKALRKIDLG